jgi:hypothetical protein
MVYRKFVVEFFLIVVLGTVLTACGGDSSVSKSTQAPISGDETKQENSSQTTTLPQNGNTYIPYLRQNHKAYTQYGSATTPVPIKDASSLSITWNIQSATENDAKILAEHIETMKTKLILGQTPRAWDRLFLAEAFMKQKHYYTTDVERSANVVVVIKEATNLCAYKIIAAHSDAVSGDFFARGDIMQDYSPVADIIISDAVCDDYRHALQSFIDANRRSRGGM